MTPSSFIINIIFTVCLSFSFHPGRGFEVIQPQNASVNTDGLVNFSCEHTANTSSVEDVRLTGILLTNKSIQKLLCQKGRNDCKNVIMHLEKPNKCLFIILNVGPEAMNMSYQCEFTVTIDDIDLTVTGTSTKLLQGNRHVQCSSGGKEEACGPFPAAAAPVSELWWMVVALLALLFLYSCVISFLYIRWRCSSSNPEDCTYVEMIPLPRNQRFDVYNG